MKESRVKEHKEQDKNNREQKETIGKRIFDYIKKEIDKQK